MIGKKLKQLRLDKKLTLEQLAHKLNETYPNTVNFNKGKLSKWENEKEEPKLSSIRILADFYNITIDELYKNATASNNEIISKTISNLEKLDTDRQQRVYNFSKIQLKEQNKVIPIETYQEEVQASLSAGKGIINYYEADKEIVDIPHNAPDHDWIFKVKGDSMEPMFEDGDVVFANEFDPATDDIQNGRIYVIEIDGEAFIKKVYVESDCLRLVSLNKEYEDITVHAHSLINVVAVVIL